MPLFREKKKRNRKERIFKAAIELFNEKGFHLTTMKEISEKSELAVGTLYNYFSSKNDMLLAYLEQQIEKMREENHQTYIQLCKRTNDPKAVFRQIFEQVMQEFFVLDKKSLREVFMAIFSSGPHVEKGMQLDFKLIGLLESMIQVLQDRVLIKNKFPAGSIAYHLYALVMAQFMGYVFSERFTYDSVREEIDRQLEIIMEGIRLGRNRE